MRKYVCPLALITPAFVAAALVSTTLKAQPADSREVAGLLSDAKAEAAELKHDCDDLDSFVKSRLTWESYAGKVEMVKQHVNNAGKILAKLHDAAPASSAWQQEAIQKIDPLLRELGENTETAINHLNDDKAKIHFSEFKDYVKTNLQLATRLEALIADYVNYGEAKEKFERR